MLWSGLSSTLGLFRRSLDMPSGAHPEHSTTNDHYQDEDVQPQHYNAECPADDQEVDSHLFRLFVGWVPKQFTEEDLKPIFQQCGFVQDILILRDQVTGQHRGCAFVSYATQDEAENAIETLDRKLQLPGALSFLEVRFARSHHFVQAGHGPQDNKQLFFAKAPVTASEEDIYQLFSTFGEVEEVNLFRERRTLLSKGCGFVTMATREQALKAMENLNEQHVMEGSMSSLTVKWADPELQVKKKKALEDSNAENRMLFFAKVLRTASEDEVRSVFSRYGKVYDVNLFRAFQGAPTSKGCGLITMGSHDEAAAAIDGLDSKFVWEGMGGPMVVKWMDAELQRRRREEHLAAMRQGLVPSMGMGPDVWLPAGKGLAFAPTHMVPQHLKAKLPADGHETPPPGCAPDAIKLFVGNIPKHYTEEQLKPFFETVGKVVELVIVRDKISRESKGSAFVWYATRQQGERAILQFNVRHVLPDPSGEQDRPLVVRRANSRQKAVMVPVEGAVMELPQHAGPIYITKGGMAYQAAGMEPGMEQEQVYAQGPGGQQMYQQYPISSLAMGMEGMALTDGGGVAAPVHMDGGGGLSYAAMPSGGVVGHSGQVQLLSAQPMGMGQALHGMVMAGPGGSRPGHQMVALMRPGTSGSPVPGELEPLMTLPPGNVGTMEQAVTLSMQLTNTQMAQVSNHLFTIQTMTAAQIRSAPCAPGMSYLMITGSEGQVEQAKHMVSTVLSQ